MSKVIFTSQGYFCLASLKENIFMRAQGRGCVGKGLLQHKLVSLIRPPTSPRTCQLRPAPYGSSPMTGTVSDLRAPQN